MTRCVFVAALLFTGAVTIAPRPVQAAQPPASGQSRDFKKEIGVTDAQDAKIQAINTKYQEKAKAIDLQIQQLPVNANKEYEALLTPEQLKKAKAIQLKYKQKQDALVKQLQDLQAQGNKEVDAVFTPDQVKKIKAIQQEQLKAAQQQNPPPK
jgi:Spy/CpxP family protein refolding chaperone